jgi:hypothetical protein
MLGQKELAFIKAISNMELSPVFMQELRKAMATAKMKKAQATTTSTGRASDEARAPVQPKAY